MNKCSVCEYQDEEMILPLSSCNHITCAKCLYKEIIYNYEQLMKITNPEDIMEIKCILCENGNYSLNNIEIYKILNEKREVNPREEIIDLNNSDTHLEKIEKLKSILPFPSIEKLCENLEEEKDEILSKVIPESDSRIENFQKLLCEIQNIQLMFDSDSEVENFENLLSTFYEIILSFRNYINQILENLDISMKNLKISFEIYYNDLENIKLNNYLNTYLLGKLSCKKFELNFREAIYEAINSSYKSLYTNFKNFEKEILKFSHQNGGEKELETEDTKKFTRSCSCVLGYNFRNLLELPDGRIVCWTNHSMEVLNHTSNTEFDPDSGTYRSMDSLEVHRTYPFKVGYSQDYTNPIIHNKCAMYTDCSKQTMVWDSEFNLIENLKETKTIYCLCDISPTSFAIGMYFGTIKIYKKDEETKQYEKAAEYKQHLGFSYVNCIIYLPKYDIIISGSSDKTIGHYSLTGQHFVFHTNKCSVTSLIQLNSDMFAAGSSDGEIKIYSISATPFSYTSIECMETIKAYHEINVRVFLYGLGNDFFVSRQFKKNEFKIWDKNSYECLKTYEEVAPISKLIVYKNYYIITATTSNMVSVWKSSNPQD